MFKPENKIIIVDDQVEHLKKLGSQFQNRGIGCRLCEYDVFFDTPFTGVRIAFFDINLNPSGTDGNSSLIPSKLAEAIGQYIGTENGPYALIFWTSHKDQIEEFKKYINERHPKLPRPFIIDCIDKQVFLNNTETLEQKLSQVLGDKTIELLFEFENIAFDAASKTTNQIYNIIPNTDSWGSNISFKQNFEIIFSKIAASTLGVDHAKENPDKAVYEALMPTLNHYIKTSISSKKWENYLTTLKLQNDSLKINLPTGFNEGKLNSVLHIEEIIDKINTRGIVVEMNKENYEMRKYFDTTFDDWVKKFIPFKKDFKANSKTERENEIQNLLQSATLIAVEISSACDYSQNNPRLNKYLMGIKTKEISPELINQPPINCFNLNKQKFHLNNNDFQIWLNLNYCFGTTPSDSRLGKPLFILKKEIMDMIGNRYANHVSRIGVTSF